MNLPMRAVAAAGCGVLVLVGTVVRSFGDGPRDGNVDRTNQKAATAPAFAPAVIGTIDIDAVKEGYEKYKMLDNELRGYFQAQNGQFMKLNVEMKSKLEQLQKLTPSSPDAKKLQEQLTEMEIKRKAFAENTQREIDQRATEVEATIYNEIQDMVKAAAIKYGLTFVVRSSSMKQIPADDPRTVAMAQSRAVIYSDPKLDLTTIVLFSLNKRYKALNPGGTPPRADVPVDANPARSAAPANPR